MEIGKLSTRSVKSDSRVQTLIVTRQSEEHSTIKVFSLIHMKLKAKGILFESLNQGEKGLLD